MEVTLPLVGLAEWGHLTAPDLAPLWMPVGLVGMLASGLEALPWSPWRRWYALIASVLGSSWMAGAWTLGVTDGASLLCIGLFGVPLAVAWWLHERPRSRIQVDGGSRWPWRWRAWRFRARARGELGSIAARWGWIAKRLGIEHSTLLSLIADPEEGYVLHIELARGALITDVKADRLSTTLREFQSPTVVVGDRPHVVVIREHLVAVVESELRPWEAAEEAPAPEAMDVDGERLERLAAALGNAPEGLSARAAAEAAGVPRDWTWRVGLPELERLGRAGKAGKSWHARLPEELVTVRHAVDEVSA